MFGHLNFVTAFQHSVNSVFCNIGKQIGAATILDYAKRFGFYKTPPLETPADERAPSGITTASTPLDANASEGGDPGRLAFGQWTMQVTPLQMAMVAATVANGGVVTKPYVVQKIVTTTARRCATRGRRDLGRAIKPQTAQS